MLEVDRIARSSFRRAPGGSVMPRQALPPLERQLRRVRRRLFLQSLFNSLAVSWTVALALGACWIAAQPHVIPGASALLRWSVAGGAIVVASALAVAIACARRPNSVAAALELDERFGLKERTTTSLTLAPADATSPAALALLDDVNSRVDRINVSDHFPVSVPRSAWFVPAAGAVLALVALFYKPAVVTPKAVADQQLNPPPAVKEEIEKKMEQLQKRAEAKRPDDKNRSAELERLEAELDRLTKQPRETQEQARELVKDLTGIEEQIKKREQQLVQRADALKEQMKQVSRLSKMNDKDGPAKELNQALDHGDMQKAKNELDRIAQQLKADREVDRLRKKLEDKNLSKEERAKTEERLNQAKSKQMSKEDKENLARQMKDVKEKVQRLSRNKEEKEKELRDQAKKGKMDNDQLQRELEQLERDAGRLTDKDLENLQDLAKKMEDAEKSMEAGDTEGMAQLLEDAANQMADLDREGELQELAEKLEDCEGCKGAMCQALDGKAVPSAGRRPESKSTVTNSVQKRERVTMDKGKLSVIDTVPGDGFKGPRKPAELTEEIRRASQEAPEAIDRQRLPRSASDMARGYFDKLRGDKEKKSNP
jgi:hypothetical protein